MEGLPQLINTDDSPYETSTGPTTPDGSPLFLPTIDDGVDGKPLSHVISNVDVNKLGSRHTANYTFQSDSKPPPILVKNVCFIGAGYVGTPTAAVMALQNPALKVDVLDRDQERVRQWQSAHLPIHEPGLDDVVRAVRDGAQLTLDTEGRAKEQHSRHKPNLFFTTNSKQALSDADMIFLAVNTPTKTFGQGAGRATHMSAVDGAVKDIAKYAKSGVIIVEKSTVPCGTAKRIQQALRRMRPESEFEILSNPEFLSEGCAVQNLLKPDRILIGSAKSPSGIAAAASLADLFTPWVPSSKIVRINAWSSELAKLVANAMLAQRISSINSVSAICEETGADINEIAHSIGLDPRIGAKFLKSGLGFGGSCFRKDIASLAYLAESLGLHDVADYWRSVNEMNVLQRRRFVQRVIRRLDENLSGKKIALLGFAFKKDTGDTRESLAVDVITQTLEEQPAEISVFDPCCRTEDIRRELDLSLPEQLKGRPSNVTIHDNAYDACSRADAILIINDSDEFKHNSSGSPQMARKATLGAFQKPEEMSLPGGRTYALSQQPHCPSNCISCEVHASRQESKGPVDWSRVADSMNEPKWVFDGRCVLDADFMKSMGFRIESIGRQSAWEA